MASTAPKGLTLPEVQDALEKNAGLPQLAANFLGVHRSTIVGWMNRHPELKKMKKEAEQGVNEVARGSVISAIGREWRAAAWWLEHKDPSFRKQLYVNGRIEISASVLAAVVTSFGGDPEKVRNAIGGLRAQAVGEPAPAQLTGPADGEEAI